MIVREMEGACLNCNSWDAKVFSEQEQRTLDVVLSKIRPMSTQQVIDRSHEEDAWKNHFEGNQLIPYSEAFSLKLF